MTRKEVVGIQYLRGLAALAVVLFHSTEMTALPKYFGRGWHEEWLRYGAVGVDVFFVISGFIIAIVALCRDLQANLSVPSFAAKRAARILPLMWAAILSYAVLRGATRSMGPPLPYVRAALLIPSGPLVPNVIWTLRHEAIFYVLFGVGLAGLRFGRLPLLAWILAPLVLALIGLSEAAWYQSNMPLYILLNPVNLQFGLGTAIGIAWLRWRSSPVISPPLHPLLCLAGAMAALVVLLHTFGEEPHQTAWQALRTGVLAAGLVCFAAWARCPEGPLDRIGRLLGAASYSIYLFHEHFISAALGFWHRFAPHSPVGVVIGGVLLGSVFAGVVIHVYVEQPLVRLAQRHLGQRLTSRSPLAPVG